MDILPEHDRNVLTDQLEFLADSNSSDLGITAENTSSEDADANVSPEVFPLSGNREDPKELPWRCWVALHSTSANPGLVLLEFEIQKDEIHPLILKKPRSSDSSQRHSIQDPETGVISQGKAGMEGRGFGAFSDEDLVESTHSASTPLRRVRKSFLEDENGTIELFSILTQVNDQLNAADSLGTFLKVVVGLVKEITRFHRVMVYQFDEQWNGQVVAELVDWEETKDLFQGLHFPATDIPAQARALYAINKVRVLYDRDQPTARLVCRSQAELECPLDMTHCFLRAMSPIHCKYLANMGVRASMSISITAFGQLWGLIACHTYGNTSMRCSFLVRKLVRLMGEQISHNIERISYAARLTARKLIHAPNERNPAGYIVSKAEDLLGLFDADIGMLSIGDEGKILGPMENSQEALALREYFRQKKFETITPSSDLLKDFPDLRYEPGFKTVAGVMYIPLNRSGDDFLLFFRRGQLKKVHWAGNPYEKILERNKGQASVLLPRQSFKVWSESVLGRCKEWSEDQVETAAVLCLVYGKFIDVWREKQQALQTSKLASLLLSNAGHEVRTPLNAIINYLEIALEGSLDATTRESLEKSHAASKSLVYVINDLLDLTKSEHGQDLFRNESFDLVSTVREAVSIYRSQATRVDVQFALEEDRRLPRRVMGDQAKIRQVIGNVTANALKYTTRGSVVVQTKLLSENQSSCELAIIVTDTGCGISEERLDAIFSNFELIESAAIPESRASDQDMGTGLGLAIVARVVRNMNGQLKAESKVGRGSTFTFIFEFVLPEDGLRTRQGSTTSGTSASTTRENPVSKNRPPPVTQLMNLSSNSNAQENLAASTVSETSQVEKDPISGLMSWPSNELQAKVKEQIGQQGENQADIISRAQAPSLRSGNSSGASNIDHLVSSLLASPACSNNARSNLGSRDRAGSESGSVSSIAAERRSIPNDWTPHTGFDAPHSFDVTDTASPVDQYSDIMDNSSASLRTNESVSSHYPQTTGEEPRVANNGPKTTLIHSRARPIVRAVKMGHADVSVPQAFQDNPLGISGPAKKKRITDNSVDQSMKRIPHSSSPTQSLRILVAEDDAINRNIIQKRLQIDRHHITLANDGSDCYDEFAKEPTRYDVILMDMQMPILDGMGSARKIRELEAKQGIKKRMPIIAVSASLAESQAQEAIDSGIDGWILKPVNFKRLRHFFAGLKDNKTREADLYIPGTSKAWADGGWLSKIAL